MTLFESEASCGGHTLTDTSSGFPVDLGFQVGAGWQNRCSNVSNNQGTGSLCRVMLCAATAWYTCHVLGSSLLQLASKAAHAGPDGLFAANGSPVLAWPGALAYPAASA